MSDTTHHPTAVFDLQAAKAICSDPHFRAELRREEALIAADRAEQERSQGVRWGGMEHRPRIARTIAQMLADAQAAKSSQEAYLTSNLGKARSKIAEGSRKAEQLHARLQDVGAALSRGDGSAVRKAEDAAETLRDLRLMVADMEAFVRLAEAA